MEAVNKLRQENSYDITLTHKGFNPETGHMFEAVVVLLEDGAKEVEMGTKTIKEVTKMTRKRVSALALDKDFAVASDKALEKAAGLLGL